MKELVVELLIRGIPLEESAGDVALECYKAVIMALKDKYAIMGYSWDHEVNYR